MRGLWLLPWVAALCHGGGNDPADVLKRVRARVLESTEQLPNYTCNEVIDRTYFQPSSSRSPRSCDEHEGNKRKGIYRMTAYAADRLRLEVAVLPEREIYAWANARQFEEGNLTDMVTSGGISTGAFGSFLRSIFGGDAAWSTYVGETRFGERSLMEFRYTVPVAFSQYRIHSGDGWTVTAYDGTFLAEPETGELVRLTLRTDQLPASTGTCESRTTMDYRMVEIGTGEFLLPRETRQRFIAIGGTEVENTIAFSACRQYRGESTVHFGGEADTAPEAAAPAPPRSQQALALPANLAVHAALEGPIETKAASAGDVFTARLFKPLVDGEKRTLVTAGSLVEGRLMRVQRYFTDPPWTVVVFRLESVEVNGAQVPFRVRPDPVRSDGPNGAGARGWHEAPLPKESKYGVYFFRGNNVIVPKGYRTDWITAEP